MVANAVPISALFNLEELLAVQESREEIHVIYLKYVMVLLSLAPLM
jgi:hypothetical protein